MLGKKEEGAVKPSRRQRLWERLWASTILIYTIVATAVVWKTLSKYGVSPIIFFVIDAATSWTYGISTARLVVSAMKRDWKSSRKWTWGAAISFVTPQLYVLLAARHAPRDVYLIVIAVVSFLILFAAMSLWLQIRKSRRASAMDSSS